MGFVKRNGGGKAYAMRQKLPPRTMVKVRGHWFSVDDCQPIHVPWYEAKVVLDRITSVQVYRGGIGAHTGYHNVDPVHVVVRRMQPFISERQATQARVIGKQFAAMRKAGE